MINEQDSSPATIVHKQISRAKRSIRDALVNLMKEKDIAHITVTELAARAEINRKTFYKHYQRVKDVAAEIDANLLHRLKAEIEQRGFLGSDSNLEGVFQAMDDIVKEDAAYHKFIVLSNKNWIQLHNVKDLLKKSLLEAYEKEHPDHSADKNIELYADYDASGIVFLYYEWFKSDEGIPLRRLAEVSRNIRFWYKDENRVIT